MMTNGGRSSSQPEIEEAHGSIASDDKRKRLADHKREKKKQAKRKRGEHGEIIVEEGNDGPFYLVESIVGERLVKGRKEYQVQWKNVEEPSWEPIKNLCDSAYIDAQRFSQEQAERRAKAESTEFFLGIGKFHSKVEEVEYGPVLTSSSKAESLPVLMPSALDGERTMEDANESDVNTDDFFRWTDEEQIEYREVVRIDVHEEGANDRVREARLNGTPIVLVGHKGFPQFASRWLKREPGACPAQDKEDLDLTQSYEVDVDRMIADIGTETVPILRKNYNEFNPIEREIFASTFLEKCWPAQGSTSAQGSLYLHQWQFPLSKTAAPKLCGEGRCAPFPNEILGEDLLQFWLDTKENPFQYIFMGGDGTMSKLHRDNGGLDIFITPIVGEKECVLVHRADGDDCMYKLDAQLDHVNLHRFPMMRFARVWKTVVCPGEVLFMPQGTYHQCRNVTACLSYSRFHLDTLNLKDFLKSMIKGDAPDIQHDECIWNCAIEISDRVDNYSKQAIKESSTSDSVPPPPLSREVLESVETLRIFRHICREISLSFGRHGESDRSVSFFFAGRPEDRKSWKKMVDDIDRVLHRFKYRNVSSTTPRFQAKRVKEAGAVDVPNDEGLAIVVSTEDKNAHVQAESATQFQEEFLALPDLQPYEVGMVISDFVQLAKNDEILIRFHGKRVAGFIVKVVDQMEASLVSYEGLPNCHDEYQPKSVIPSSGVFPTGDVDGCVDCSKIDSAVKCHSGSAECHPPVVQSSKCATFYLVRLRLGGDLHSDKWICRDTIIQKMEIREAHN